MVPLAFIIYFLFLITFRLGGSNVVRYLTSLRYGASPPYIIEQHVKDAVYDVPVAITQIISILRQKEACKPGLFNKMNNIHAFEPLYIEFIRKSELPKFEYYEDAASFLLLIFYHMPHLLITPEMMKQLDEFNIIQSQQNYKLTLQSMLLLARVFNHPFPGRETLRLFLMFISEYAQKGCADGGYIDVARNVTKYFASEYVICGWWVNCGQDSAIFTISNIIKYGPENIILAFIISRVSKEVSDYTNSLHVEVLDTGCVVRSNLDQPEFLKNLTRNSNGVVQMSKLHDDLNTLKSLDNSELIRTNVSTEKPFDTSTTTETTTVTIMPTGSVENSQNEVQNAFKKLFNLFSSPNYNSGTLDASQKSYPQKLSNQLRSDGFSSSILSSQSDKVGIRDPCPLCKTLASRNTQLFGQGKTPVSNLYSSRSLINNLFPSLNNERDRSYSLPFLARQNMLSMYPYVL